LTCGATLRVGRISLSDINVVIEGDVDHLAITSRIGPPNCVIRKQQIFAAGSRDQGV